MLYVLGVTNFIGIISFVGAVALGIDTVVTMMIYLKAKKYGQRKPAYSLNLSKSAIVALTILFLVGIIVEIVKITID